MSEDDDIDHKRESWYEEEPADKKIILKDVSFNTFEDEITVITGYTGAGKSTIMCILAGILPPTSGTAIINGRNIKTNMTEIRRDLGFCPQSDVLWNKLTVMEHLYFFSRLKGISKEECRAEIETYLEVLELSELVESNNPREVAYILQEKDSPIFEKMFAEMEEEGKDHGIHSFEIYSLTMEEVLMSVKVGVDIEHDEHYTSSVSEYVLTSNRCTLENIVW
ncbi:hypothetical protein Trydic_g7577 [Trypoxylus dichotomus]